MIESGALIVALSPLFSLVTPVNGLYPEIKSVPTFALVSTKAPVEGVKESPVTTSPVPFVKLRRGSFTVWSVNVATWHVSSIAM